MISERRSITSHIIQQEHTTERLFAPLTIFFGATLLFSIEPIIAKMILPWFGGSAEVWIVCLLFFQMALLAGYFYAHFVTSHMNARSQMRVHLSLLAISLIFLPVIPSEYWKPTGGEEPLLLILIVLGSTIGLPFLLLASTGPLLQTWLSHLQLEETNASRTIYRLYALSNIGSLLALLLYPLLVEPWLATSAQAKIWSALYCVFAFFSAATAWHYRNRITKLSRISLIDERPSFDTLVLWFMLAAAPSALLLAITNHMLRNIAAIPLLWVVPLGLYLLSFIICFDNPRWYYRPLWYVLFAGAAGTMIYNVVGLFLVENYVLQLAYFAGGMFICCMVCHGELASRKPNPNYLTKYYLIIAAGGATGGAVIAVIAPLVFSDDYDLPLVLAAVALLAMLIAWRRIPLSLPAWLRWNALICLFYCWAAVVGHMALAARSDRSGNLLSLRNFYGPLRVTKQSTDTEEIIQLRNGNVVHGREFTALERRCEPTSYYGRRSGIGIAIQEAGRSGSLMLGVIGLGAGTIAGYGRKDDTFHFYEINPLVQSVASGTFHYLACPGEHNIVIGDARLSLEREANQQFDLLAVDAFTSDAIPVHLLTKEAFALYWQHLKRDGVLAVHVSNQYIDLAPIVAVAAREAGKTARMVQDIDDPAKGIDRSLWVLVTRSPDFFLRPAFASSQAVETRNAVAWTDDYSNLWRALK